MAIEKKVGLYSRGFADGFQAGYQKAILEFVEGFTEGYSRGFFRESPVEDYDGKGRMWNAAFSKGLNAGSANYQLTCLCRERVAWPDWAEWLDVDRIDQNLDWDEDEEPNPQVKIPVPGQDKPGPVDAEAKASGPGVFSQEEIETLFKGSFDPTTKKNLDDLAKDLKGV